VDAALLALPWRLGYTIRVLVTQMVVRGQYRHPCDSHILNSEQAHLRPKVLPGVVRVIQQQTRRSSSTIV